MRGLRQAIAMFTIAPVPSSWHTDATSDDARRAVPWLPLIGAVLGGLAGLVGAAVLGGRRDATLIAAVAVTGVLALGARGLHLDGLADTADGLGSRRAPDEALAVMRRSDIGPFGVLAIVFVVLLDVAAFARIGTRCVWAVPAAAAVAAATGRVAVLHATTRHSPSARTSGFGALVAGTTRPVVAGALSAVVLGAGAGLAAVVPDASVIAWPCAQAAALVVAWGVRWHAVCRFGGVTGDVFGALIEVGTAATLLGIALA